MHQVVQLFGRFRRKLLFRIARIFVGLMLSSVTFLYGSLYIEATTRLSLSVIGTYSGLAPKLVSEVEPLVKEVRNEEALIRTLYRIQSQIPIVEIILLDQNRHLYKKLIQDQLSPHLSAIADSLRGVNKPVHGATWQWPTYTDIFSAAPLIVEGQPGLLLVVMDSRSGQIVPTMGMVFDYESLKLFGVWILILSWTGLEKKRLRYIAVHTNF